MAVLDQAELARIRVQLPRVFTPGAPIRRTDFLSGRRPQINKTIDAVSRPGQHAILWGERGVGKTSLAGLIHRFWMDASRDSDVIAVRVNCDPLDDYATIWANIAEEIQEVINSSVIDLKDREARLLEETEGVVGGQATPNIVRKMLASTEQTLIVVVDELDRLQDQESIGLMADTIKTLSDRWVNATLVLVGVADSVDELIHEHASIDRALVQILVPRMAPDELDAIISTGANALGLEIDDRVRSFIVRVGQGLPYYVHLLCLTTALNAVTNARRSVTWDDLGPGLSDAVDSAKATAGSAYYQATTSPRRDSLAKEVLLACSLVPVDELGYFQPASVLGPLGQILKRDCNVGTATRILEALTTEAKGRVLQLSGSARRKRYRFRDPLLKPYIVLKGFESGMLRDES